MLRPRCVENVRLDGKPVDGQTVYNALTYFTFYIIILLIAGLIVSLDGLDFTTNFTAALSCLSNVGPGLSLVGPTGSFFHLLAAEQDRAHDLHAARPSGDFPRCCCCSCRSLGAGSERRPQPERTLTAGKNHTAPQVIRLAGRFFQAALRRTKDAASKAFVQREARGQGLRLRHYNLAAADVPQNFTTTPCRPGLQGCRSLSKSLAEFRRRSGERKSNHFLRRHVRLRKYFSGCKCGICVPQAHKLCAQQTVAPLSKSNTFDSNDPAGSCPWGDGSACPKASQSFAAAAAKESLIIFFGDMCGEENTARPQTCAPSASGGRRVRCSRPQTLRQKSTTF